MEFIKFEIDELTADSVFCQYREVTEEGKGELKSRSFPLEKIGAEVPDIPRLVSGTTTNIYYEQRGDFVVSEKRDINNTLVTLTEDEITFCIETVKKACIDEMWDELLKPPSVDEQVEDFIKQFFEEEDEPLEQKDFLAEFFDELEEEDAANEIVEEKQNPN
tara:strand:- start:235 stop:720 length:486 start_codon:yes stop_codon:yes gene_type:complete